MSEELTRLTVSVEHIEKTLEEILPKIDKHEIACETHAPMAKQAHEATTELSIFMSNQDLKLNALIERNDAKDLKDDRFQELMFKKFDDIAKATNEKDIEEAKRMGRIEGRFEALEKRNSNVLTFFVLLCMPFFTWMALSIIEGKENDAKRETPKAIKHNTKVKVKKDKDK